MGAAASALPLAIGATGREPEIEAEIEPACTHRFIELWGAEGWHGGRCKAHVTDPARIGVEQAHAEGAAAEDQACFGW